VKTFECPREHDVLDALTTGRMDDELRQHVAACAICADVVDVAAPILIDREDRSRAPHIPSSAVMWWRAQKRARQDAAREAARPITVAHVVGVLSAAGIAIALAVMLSPWLRGAMSNVIAGASSGFSGFSLQTAILSHGWLMPALMITVLLLLTPIAIYFAVAED
jgi:hypothetical protein